MCQEERSRLDVLIDRVTRDHADEDLRESLYEALYDDLRRKARILMSRERIDHTLGPTDLVHNAYFKLINSDSVPERSRSYFLGAASRAMRQVLIDHARKKNAAKRGGEWQKVDLSHVGPMDLPDPVDIMAVADALESLQELDSRAADVITLRFFSDLTMEEIGHALGVTRQTVHNDFKVAMSWLKTRLHDVESP